MHLEVHPTVNNQLIYSTLCARLLQQRQGLVQREGVLNAEGAAAGADEAAKVRAGAQGLPKVTRKRPDVGALAAGNADNRLRQPQGRCICYVYAAGCCGCACSGGD